MTRVESDELRSFLRDINLLSPEELSEADSRASARDVSLFEELSSSGLLDEDELRRASAHACGVPFVELFERDLPYEILSLIPESIARDCNAIAYARTEDTVEVALLDLDDRASLSFLEREQGVVVTPRLTTRASMRHALRRYQRSLAETFGARIRRDAETLTTAGTIDDPALVRLVDTLLAHALAQRAHDVHIEPRGNARPSLVRYRVDGVLRDAMMLPDAAARRCCERLKSLAGLEVEETKKPQEGRMRVSGASEVLSLRIATMPTSTDLSAQTGEKVVLHLSRGDAERFTLDGLGLAGDSLERVYEALRTRSGLVLVTGPSRAGVTTTLYTMIDTLEDPGISIATIEDRIEYRMPRINQTRVRGEAGLSMAAAIRSAALLDSDVIVIDSLADADAAARALAAASSGRLVIAGVRANSAAEAIGVLRDKFGVDADALAATLTLVIAQRCAPRGAHTGARTHTPDEIVREAPDADTGAVLAALREEGRVSATDDLGSVPFPEVDDEAGDRIGIFETLFVSPALRECIRGGARERTIARTARAGGTRTLEEQAILAAARGYVSLAAALRAVRDR